MYCTKGYLPTVFLHTVHSAFGLAVSLAKALSLSCTLYVQTYAHTYIHLQTASAIFTHRVMPQHVQTENCTHNTCTCAYTVHSSRTHSSIHTHTHTCTHAHAYTHTHTPHTPHTHTHTTHTHRTHTCMHTCPRIHPICTFPLHVYNTFAHTARDYILWCCILVAQSSVDIVQ